MGNPNLYLKCSKLYFNVKLKNGSKGEGVKELQRFLNVKLNLGLVIDGKLGPKTIAVIKKCLPVLRRGKRITAS